MGSLTIGITADMNLRVVGLYSDKTLSAPTSDTVSRWSIICSDGVVEVEVDG